MDVAVWMSPAVLEHKLSARDERNTIVTWNVALVPRGLGRPGIVDRVFVASAGAWRGYFILSKEALWTPEDPAAPYTLLLDTSSWTPVPPTPVRRFRGLRPMPIREEHGSKPGTRKEKKEEDEEAKETEEKEIDHKNVPGETKQTDWKDWPVV